MLRPLYSVLLLPLFLSGLFLTLIADDGWHFNRQAPVPLPAGMGKQFDAPQIHALVTRPNLWLMGVGYYDGSLPYANEAGGGIYTSQDGEHWTLAQSGLTPEPV